MIKIVDYGLGNTQAFLTAFKRLDVPADRARNSEDLRSATHLVLPGVGAFDRAMELLNESGMRETLEDLVLNQAVPVLGICVGMQLLASGSEEGELSGLSWVPGWVKKFPEDTSSHGECLPLPHMGWNDLNVDQGALLFREGFSMNPRFYFLHSYYFDADPVTIDATAHYGIDFAAAVSHGNVFGIQCHPEKSHGWGLQLLKNFARL